MAWLQLARAENVTGNSGGTLRALERPAELSPDSGQMLAMVGFGYINLNRVAAGVPPLTLAAKLLPNEAWALSSANPTD